MVTGLREAERHSPWTSPRDVPSQCPRSRLPSPCLRTRPSIFSTQTTTTMSKSRSSLHASAALASTTKMSSPTLAPLPFHPVAPPCPTAPTAHLRTRPCPVTAHPIQTAAHALASATESPAKASASSSTAAAPGADMETTALTAQATSARAKRTRFNTPTATLAATASSSLEDPDHVVKSENWRGWSSEEGRMREIRLYIPLSGQTLANWRLFVSFPKFLLLW